MVHTCVRQWFVSSGEVASSDDSRWIDGSCEGFASDRALLAPDQFGRLLWVEPTRESRLVAFAVVWVHRSDMFMHRDHCALRWVDYISLQSHVYSRLGGNSVEWLACVEDKSTIHEFVRCWEQ